MKRQHVFFRLLILILGYPLSIQAQTEMRFDKAWSAEIAQKLGIGRASVYRALDVGEPTERSAAAG